MDISSLESLTSRQERDDILNTLAEKMFTEVEHEKWDESQRRAIVALVAHGFIRLAEKETAGDERDVVCDLEKFTEDYNWRLLRRDMGDFAGTSSRNRKSKMQVFADLSEALGDVYSTADYEREDALPKKLVYVPQGNPLDVAQIREDRSHLGLWELSSQAMFQEYYPNVSSEAGANEVILAALVYHPNWGAGTRDENGVLNVTYPNGQRKRVTGDFFATYGYAGSTSEINQPISASPVRYLEHCPNLAAAELLTSRDFRTYSGEVGFLADRRLTERPVGKKGGVMLDGVKYFFGTVHEQDYAVAKLSDEYGVLTHKIPNAVEVSGVFKLLSPAEKAAQLEYRTFPIVTQRELHDRGLLSKEEFASVEPRAGEVLNQWVAFLEFSKSMERTGLNVTSYSVREQAVLWEVLAEGRGQVSLNEMLGQEDLPVSARNNRIKTLLTVANNLKDAEVVVQIAREPNTEFLFENVAAIADVVGTFEEHISTNDAFSDVQKNDSKYVQIQNSQCTAQSYTYFYTNHVY